MGNAFLYGNGSGGAQLNFRVIGGTSEPTSPKENTIWVNTDVKITNWSFSVSEPEAPIDGEIWFSIGTASTVAFNALKKNTIMIYPDYALQYVDGEWCDIDVKMYKNNAWVDFPTEALYLLKDGNQYLDITGGWSGIASDAIVLSKSATDSSNAVGVAETLSTQTINKIDVTKYNLISANVDSLDKYMYIQLIGDSDNIVYRSDALEGSGVVAMDLQNITGEYYIRFYVDGSYVNNAGTASFTISEIKLEKQISK